MEQQQEISPSEFLAILKRRKWSLIVPAAVIFLLVAVVALVLPPVYKSSSTILIEEQEIPQNFVQNTVTSYAEQRLQTINQRIMSSNRLLEIINELGLYQDLQGKMPTEEIIGKMREAIQLEPISAEVMDRRTGRPATATIAFTLSYEGKESPAKVQKVASVLASLFLEENLRDREQQAQGTYKFLNDEAGRVKGDLEAIEAKLANFKKQNINKLPDLLQVNLQNLHSIELNVERLDEQLRSLEERRGYLETQLASTPKSLETENKKRLEELRVQLVHLQTRFTDSYPDVIKTKAEIAELEKQLGIRGAQIDAEADPENPAYVTLASQLSSTQSEIASVKKQLKDLKARENMYQERIEATPRVEETYRALVNERDNTRAQYDDLTRKLMEAKVSEGLEKEQKGERFTLIDPARLPEQPDKPNRLAIMLIGLVLGLGAGVGFASLREYSDQSVRSPDALAAATSFPVLVSVPIIVTAKDLMQKRHRRRMQMVATAVLVVSALVAFHFLVMDFNILWVKLGRRLVL